ncbi:cell wall metabolism sensor histidine kinase WalK [Paenibacillus sp. NAIST15-1]|uniref:sensor histidine kinase n=1 Tax=Paenibacillus sp. NAIST15-1 TaxID=1605994 RepID=UPI00086CCF70|nr:ATP-binding protein [Paenibacillus sp. NAIST15-1]GAV16070.1 sensor histidine kinase YclK [Paenibacillus sp. NAIST15-1]
MIGIRQRLVGSYLAVILTTVCILEVILITSVNYYYHYNVERALINQAEISAAFFQQYFAEEEVAEQSEKLVRAFSQHTSAQVQIMDAAGHIIQDSYGTQAGKEIIRYTDVQQAAAGEVGTWRGFDDDTNEHIVSVSYPLQSEGKTVGIVRFISSLTGTIDAVRYISILFILAGVLVVAIVAMLSIFLSRTITGPIRELKKAAEVMADGNFSIRAKKVYRDELGTLADTMNAMASRISRNEQLKNEFISSVSHEIRTPLTNIKGWAVTLKAGGTREDDLVTEGLDIIESETDRLSQLVDELLDFSKLDAGRLELAFSLVDVPRLVQQIGILLSPRAARLGIKLHIHSDPMFPIIFADENRLRQVLINLLDNAFKFTNEQGEIDLNARAFEHEVMISVRDTGSGIQEHELGMVMKKFYKGKNSPTGSGLGLSISEEIIRLHQGRIEMESEQGIGTEVRIYLPIHHEIGREI